MQDSCNVCGSPFTQDDPLYSKGRHHRCYQQVWRAEKHQKEILEEARAICDEISERYQVRLVLEDVGSPFGISPVSWTLLCVDRAIQQRLEGVPDDPVLQLEALAGEAKGPPAEM